MIASSRFDVAPAEPHALLAQELINTKRPGQAPVSDLLDDVATAEQWLDEVIGSWTARSGGVSPRALAITDRDLAELRELRTTVEASIDPREQQGRPLRGVVQLRTRDGELVGTEATAASVATWLESTILVDRFRAELVGEWGRVKLCGNPECRVAFYDRSRNRAGVWHNVERCGNKINLRNLRARRAAKDPDGASPLGR